MKLKKELRRLILGIILLSIGLGTSFAARTFSETRGGKYVLAEKVEEGYFLLDQFDNYIEITKQEYFIQNLLGIMSIMTLIIAFILIFITFFKLTVRGFLYRLKGK